jgi:solute carrier family 45 protein 1/2/4
VLPGVRKPVQSHPKGSSSFETNKRLKTDSRLAAFGHLLSYGIGSVDLVTTFGTRFGDSQFKQLALISIFAVLTTCALTCWAVTEKVLVASGDKEKGKDEASVAAAVRTIWTTLRHLPPRVQAICWAHFWSWIGMCLIPPL